CQACKTAIRFLPPPPRRVDSPSLSLIEPSQCHKLRASVASCCFLVAGLRGPDLLTSCRRRWGWEVSLRVLNPKRERLRVGAGLLRRKILLLRSRKIHKL